VLWFPNGTLYLKVKFYFEVESWDKSYMCSANLV